jgi:periplasmic protein TonB
MVAVSLAAHGLLVAVGVVVSFWHVDELSAPAVPVTFLTAPTPPPPPPPARVATPRKPRAPRPTPTALVQPPRPEPVAQPVPMEEDEPEASDQGVADGVAGGIAGGQVGGTLPPPDPNQRRSLLERYLRELFRSRIAARFRYPPEAERDGIEGVVVMRVAIDGSGKLIELHLVGSCQHAVLCEAASRTLLASAPFPPPPAELGGAIAVDVPLAYRLE